MAKLMVLGDTHGNTDVAIMAVQSAANLDLDGIVQVGDFGLWDHFKDGVQFLDELNRELMDNNLQLIWVDGNHENFDRLEWYCRNNPKNKWGQVYIRSNILYSPRGCKWKVDDKMLMSVGGAVSVDRQSRKKGYSWWPQEQLTDADLEEILRQYDNSPGQIDFLFTHDCPTNAPFRGRLKNDMDSMIHRQRMDRLGKAVKPIMWFHGHMHTKYDGYDFPEYEPTTTVYGIECDGMRWNWGVLDTDTYTFDWGHKLKATEFYKELDKVEESWSYDEETQSYTVTKPAVGGEWVEWKDNDWLEGYGYNDEPFDMVLPD